MHVKYQDKNEVILALHVASLNALIDIKIHGIHSDSMFQLFYKTKCTTSPKFKH